MLHKTRGIVLNYIRYRETSIIVKIYTELFGIQSYIVNGVRSSKSKTNRIAFFQPLTLLDLVVYHKSKEQTLHRLSEVKCSIPFKSLPFDFIKSSMAMFLTEILVKTLKEEEKNESLFDFLQDSILELENSAERFENFHLMFMAKLAFYLGFGSETAKEIEEQLTENTYPIPTDDVMREALQVFISAPYNYNYNLDRRRRNELLDLVVYHKNKEQTLHRLSEVKCSIPFKSLPFDFIKSSMAMFLTEILVKTLKEEEQNESLFDFLQDSILELENSAERFENFHLMFMAKLAFYLGFGSETAKEIEEQLTENTYPIPTDDVMREALQVFISAPYNYNYNLDRRRRNELLDSLIYFYKLHLEGIGEMKSVEVLRELMK